MSAIDELLPCPFCGGRADYWHTPHVGGLHNCAVLDACGIAIECTKCHATTIGYMSEDWAIAAWNRRASHERN